MNKRDLTLRVVATVCFCCISIFSAIGQLSFTVPGGEPAAFNIERGLSYATMIKTNLGHVEMQAATGVYVINAKIEVEGSTPVEDYFYPFGNELTLNGTYIPWQTTAIEDPAGGNFYLQSDAYGIIRFDLGYKLYLYYGPYACTKFTISYKITTLLGATLLDWRGVEIYPFIHGNGSLFTADLMVRDNPTDKGTEPTSYSDYRQATNSPDIWNNWDDHNWTNENQNPMHSIRNPPNQNIMRVLVINRSCVSAPAADLYGYWTIARLWEPWAHDWLNWSASSSISGTGNSNFPPNRVIYSGERPLGGPISMGGLTGYNHTPVPISTGSFDAGSAHESDMYWVVPDPAWYLGQTSFPIEYAQANGQPVICLLARLEEIWKGSGNGFYSSPVVTENASGNQIVDYAAKNNNVATRNLCILNSTGGYKRRPTEESDYYGNSGFVMVNNPQGLRKINIGIANDGSGPSLPDFTLNGQINLYLDELLWDRWVAAGSYGQNIEVVDDQIIRITSNDFATLDSISLDSDEISWIAVETEYYPASPPEAGYDLNFSLGPYDVSPTEMIGAPTHFYAAVINTPCITTNPNDFYSDPEPIASVLGYTAINEHEGQSLHLTVYPNPARQSVFANFTLPKEENIRIAIYSLQGKEVKAFDYIAHSGRNNIPMDLAGINPGMYVIHFMSDSGQSKAKFLITE